MSSYVSEGVGCKTGARLSKIFVPLVLYDNLVFGSTCLPKYCQINGPLDRGGSRIISRGGGGFSKNFRKLTTFFFRSIRLIFRALPKQ